MASAPVALGLGGIASILIFSGIQGKSVSQIVQGDFGKPLDPKGGSSAGGGEGLENQQGAGGATIEGAPAGLISPFPFNVPVKWGRSDQGIDGTVPPGAPMVAMGNGVVTIEHDPAGFGANYLMLHVDGDGSYYYGHSVPVVGNNARVSKGQIIAHANTNGQGNATTPGAFEIGKWPPGSFSTAGASIRKWFIGLPRIKVK